jgi:hypothetical protein
MIAEFVRGREKTGVRHSAHGVDLVDRGNALVGDSPVAVLHLQRLCSLIATRGKVLVACVLGLGVAVTGAPVFVDWYRYGLESTTSAAPLNTGLFFAMFLALSSLGKAWDASRQYWLSLLGYQPERGGRNPRGRPKP